MPGFLSLNEITRMLADFDNLLASAEASTVTAAWITAHSEPYNDRYKQYPPTDVATWQTQDIKCIFQTITPTDKAYIDAGILKVGDAILYIARNYDLTGKEGLQFTFNVRVFYPKLSQPNFTDLLGVPLGNQQMCQVVACTQVQEKI